MKTYKSLDAYKYFVAGFVTDMKCALTTNDMFVIKARWGCSHRKEAVEAYKQFRACQGHTGITVTECGLFLSHDVFFLGATPEFCLHTCDGQTRLKRDHQYYFQLRCQLYVTRKSYSDFVVFTSPDPTTCHIFVERHTLNGAFINTFVDTCKLLLACKVFCQNS